MVRTEKQQGKGHVVRRMFADIDADVYLMADGDLTYDPTAAPAMVDLLLAEQFDMVVGTRRHEAKHAYRGGHVLGNKLFTGLLSGSLGAVSAISSPATGRFPAGSSKASRCCRPASRSRPR